MSVIFLDGRPGVGKNFVATKVFQDVFGYHHYDGDDALPKHEISSIQQGKIPSHKMRQDHASRILSSLKGLNRKYSKIIITHAFMKNIYREIVLKDASASIFMLVECQENIRVRRLESRKNHIVSSKFAQELDSEFEKPSFPCWTIYNEADGVDELLKQVSDFFSAKDELC